MTPGDVPSGLSLREVRELVEENKRLKAQLVKMDEALNADIDAAVERALKAGMKGTEELRASLGALPDEDLERAMLQAYNEVVWDPSLKHFDTLNGPDSIHVARDEKWK